MATKIPYKIHLPTLGKRIQLRKPALKCRKHVKAAVNKKQQAAVQKYLQSLQKRDVYVTVLDKIYKLPGAPVTEKDVKQMQEYDAWDDVGTELTDAQKFLFVLSLVEYTSDGTFNVEHEKDADGYTVVEAQRIEEPDDGWFSDLEAMFEILGPCRRQGNRFMGYADDDDDDDSDEEPPFDEEEFAVYDFDRAHVVDSVPPGALTYKSDVSGSFINYCLRD